MNLKDQTIPSFMLYSMKNEFKENKRKNSLKLQASREYNEINAKIAKLFTTVETTTK